MYMQYFQLSKFDNSNHSYEITHQRISNLKKKYITNAEADFGGEGPGSPGSPAPFQKKIWLVI